MPPGYKWRIHVERPCVQCHIQSIQPWRCPQTWASLVGSDGVEFGHEMPRWSKHSIEASWIVRMQSLRPVKQPSPKCSPANLTLPKWTKMPPHHTFHRLRMRGRGRNWPLSVVLWTKYLLWKPFAAFGPHPEQSSGCTPASTRHMTWPGLMWSSIGWMMIF